MRTILYCIPLAALTLCSSLMLSGMTNAPGPSPAFDHAVLHVSDLARSASFYEGLGLRRIADPFKDDRHVWLSMGSQQQLHLIAGGRANPEADMDCTIEYSVLATPRA